ncbi:MAG: hypothetical protein U0R44_04305 [Candidatus Micrarchaeia archaeon]
MKEENPLKMIAAVGLICLVVGFVLSSAIASGTESALEKRATLAEMSLAKNSDALAKAAASLNSCNGSLRSSQANLDSCKADLRRTQDQAAAGSADTASKAASLRVMLNSIEREHTALAISAARAAYDGSSSFNATAASLDENSAALSNAFTSIYGADAGYEFQRIWTKRIGSLADYAAAVRAKNATAKAAAESDMASGSAALADLLSRTNPGLKKTDLEKMTDGEMIHLKASVDAYTGGDYAASYLEQHNAYEKVGELADAMAAAIAMQKPEIFGSK